MSDSDTNISNATETGDSNQIDLSIQVNTHETRDIDISESRRIQFCQNTGHEKNNKPKQQQDASRITPTSITIADGVSLCADGAKASRETVAMTGDILVENSDMALAALLTIQRLHEKLDAYKRFMRFGNDLVSTVISYKIEEEYSSKFLTGISIGDSSLQIIRDGEVIQVNKKHDFFNFYPQLIANRLNNRGLGKQGTLLNQDVSRAVDQLSAGVRNSYSGTDTESINQWMHSIPSLDLNASVCSLFSSRITNIGVSNDLEDLENGFISLDGLIDIVASGEEVTEERYKLVIDYIRDNITFRFELKEGDIVVLSTDGLDLPNEQIVGIAYNTNEDENLADMLVQAQLSIKEGRYQDNITVVSERV